MARAAYWGRSSNIQTCAAPADTHGIQDPEGFAGSGTGSAMPPLLELTDDKGSRGGTSHVPKYCGRAFGTRHGVLDCPGVGGTARANTSVRRIYTGKSLFDGLLFRLLLQFIHF